MDWRLSSLIKPTFLSYPRLFDIHSSKMTQTQADIGEDTLFDCPSEWGSLSSGPALTLPCVHKSLKLSGPLTVKLIQLSGSRYDVVYDIKLKDGVEVGNVIYSAVRFTMDMVPPVMVSSTGQHIAEVCTICLSEGTCNDVSRRTELSPIRIPRTASQVS